MTAPLESTWISRELPILRAALERIDAGEDSVDLRRICEDIGLDMSRVLAGVRALETASPPYLEADYIKTAQIGAIGGFIHTVTERTRRELGTWPSPETVVDRLVEALLQAADAEQEPGRRSKARVAADAIGGYLRDLSVQAIGTQIGGGGLL